MTNATTNLHAGFESASNSQKIAADEYQKLLNDKQRAIVMYHRSWCKNALKQGKPIEPYRVLVQVALANHMSYN